MMRLLRSLRPEQWLKNGFVLAPLIFSGSLTDSDAVIRSLLAVVAFCAVASATYLINDVLDREADRGHPVKRNRPIASGAVGVGVALGMAFILIIVGAGVAWFLGDWFSSVLGAYLVITLLYSTLLKQLVFVDVLVVALGFVLRVVGGAVAIEVPVSRWILLCAYLLALYLALGKRRSELVLLGEAAGSHRVVLGHYTLPMVDQAISVVLGATVLAYTLYTVAPDTVVKVGSEGLMATVPVVLYGLFRYLYLLHRHELGGSPTKALLTDRPLLVCVLLWLGIATVVMRVGSS
ncbi:MAG: decaprenyl-phosphate phosphoribosyltransferase [Acidobacteria bacterium]|nr:MAG: decaprenyl-phosphate phosphoribosyltransferase [Acidobacteriota bacterium]